MIFILYCIYCMLRGSTKVLTSREDLYMSILNNTVEVFITETAISTLWDNIFSNDASVAPSLKVGRWAKFWVGNCSATRVRRHRKVRKNAKALSNMFSAMLLISCWHILEMHQSRCSYKPAKKVSSSVIPGSPPSFLITLISCISVWSVKMIQNAWIVIFPCYGDHRWAHRGKLYRH